MYDPINCGCGNNSKNEYAIPFAAWELRLYLNTHPCDAQALAAYRQLCMACGGNCNYACHTPAMRMNTHNQGNARSNASGCGCTTNTCGMPYHADHDGERVWHWIDDPWPWELAANMKGGCC